MRNSILLGIAVWLIMLVPVQETAGQGSPAGARSASLGGISTGLGELWAVSNNPAGLAGLGAISVATCLEQRYLMKELGNYGAALAIPAGHGCLGLFSSFTGYQSWIEQQLTFGYGMAFGQNFQAGINLVYIFQKAGNESRSMHQVSYGIGTMVILSPRVHLSFFTFNPFQLYYRNREYATLPSIYRLGLTYNYQDVFRLYSEIEKDLDHSLVIRLGSEYTLREVFILRCGLCFFPFSWAFGTAIRHNRYLFEFSAEYHQYLGFTPVVSLQFDLK